MTAFDNVTVELETLLSQHFRVVATHSQRQDQWYKRSYQAFKAEHGDRQPLILVPHESQEEWIPHARRFASILATRLRTASDARIAEQNVISQKPDSKLFSDSVLDRIHDERLSRAVTGQERLPPFAMQVSRWTSDDGLIFSGPHRRKGIMGLIACGEVDVLLRLATLPRSIPPNGQQIDPFTWRIMNWDWQDIVDTILIIMTFLAALDAFPNDFLAEEGYKLWVPIAFRGCNRTGISPLLSYIEAGEGRIPKSTREIQQEVTKCITALTAAQAFSAKAGYDAINWDDRFIDSLLYHLGFESWNRSREGEYHLKCDLNVRKAVPSLCEDDVNIEGEAFQNIKSTSSSKRIDPLRLREPKKEMMVELSPEEQNMSDELAVLENGEKDYGRKRSTKYMRKQ